MLGDQSVVYFPEELSLLGDILDQVLESLPTAMRGHLTIELKLQKTSWLVLLLVNAIGSNSNWRLQ